MIFKKKQKTEEEPKTINIPQPPLPKLEENTYSIFFDGNRWITEKEGIHCNYCEKHIKKAMFWNRFEASSKEYFFMCDDCIYKYGKPKKT